MPRARTFLKIGIVVAFSGLVGLLMWRSQLTKSAGPCVQLTPDTRRCRIDRPIVNQWLTEYPQILFEDGDLVTIAAGGCTNHGGSGNTWKRYVDPVGSKAERFYHGLIHFLGGPPGPIRLKDAIQRPWKIRTRGLVSPASLTLYLGYEDEEYPDNSYTDRDDGVRNQCRGVPDAYVELTIERNGVAPGDPPPAPMDLEGLESIDHSGGEAPPWSEAVNLLPHNPRWGLQRTAWPQRPDPHALCFRITVPPGGGPVILPTFDDPNCTTQHPSMDLPSSIPNAQVCSLGSGLLKGHVNYFPAIFTGIAQFEGLAVDNDYGFYLVPDHNFGLSQRDMGGTIEMEFDSDETIDQFATQWWTQFHTDVDAGTGRRLGPKRVVVAGLVGLDCQHGCQTEIHPVFAMAMLVEELRRGTDYEQVWALFVRDTGNEGFCSSAIHRFAIPEGIFHFSFPWPTGASGYTIGPRTDLRANVNGMGWAHRRLQSSNGIGVDFWPFPRAGSVDPFTTMVHGELHLIWRNAGGLPGIDSPIISRADSGSAEEQYRKLLDGLNPSERAFYEANRPAGRDMVANAVSLGTVPSGGPAGPVLPGPSTSIACRKAIRDARQFDVFLRAQTGQGPPPPNYIPPGLPEVCVP